MLGKKILVLNDAVTKIIDEKRGDMERAEFIELCVNNCFGDDEVMPQQQLTKDEPIYATKADMEDFKRSIKDILEAFLDFYISFGLELSPWGAGETPKDLKNQFRAMLGENEQRNINL